MWYSIIELELFLGNIKLDENGTYVWVFLTHLPLDKMAAFLQMIFSDAFSWMENFCISFKISLKFVPKGPIDNNPAMVQIMAWGQIGDKLLSEPMLTWFTAAYMRH